MQFVYLKLGKRYMYKSFHTGNLSWFSVYLIMGLIRIVYRGNIYPWLRRRKERKNR